MDYILNEISVNPAGNIDEARLLIKNFVDCCHAARNILQLETLRIPENIGSLYSFILTHDYPLASWLHDHQVDFDLREMFRQIIATHPLINDDEIKELDIFNTSYFFFNGAESKGLGSAFLLNTLSVSFLSDHCWDNHLISISHNYLNADDTESTINETINHASLSQHISNHTVYFENLRKSLLSKCKDIWERRNELFPNLTFCGKTQKQLLYKLSSGYVDQIFDRLAAMDKYIAERWTMGTFNYVDLNGSTNIRCSPESDCTMDKYGDQRLFSLYPGRSEYFTLHIKTGDLRLHFYADNNTRRVYIGYIGPHLDICTS